MGPLSITHRYNPLEFSLGLLMNYHQATVGVACIKRHEGLGYGVHEGARKREAKTLRANGSRSALAIGRIVSPDRSGPTADNWSGGSANSVPGSPSGSQPGFARFSEPGLPGAARPSFPASADTVQTPIPPFVAAGNPMGGFGSDSTPGSTSDRGDDSPAGNQPATWMLYLGLIIPLATLPMLLMPGWPWHVAGWLIAIAGSLGFLTAFTIVDLRRRSEGSYADKPGLLAGLRIAVVVVGIVVAGLQIYPVAEMIARWDRWA